MRSDKPAELKPDHLYTIASMDATTDPITGQLSDASWVDDLPLSASTYATRSEQDQDVGAGAYYDSLSTTDTTGSDRSVDLRTSCARDLLGTIDMVAPRETAFQRRLGNDQNTSSAFVTSPPMTVDTPGSNQAQDVDWEAFLTPELLLSTTADETRRGQSSDVDLETPWAPNLPTSTEMGTAQSVVSKQYQEVDQDVSLKRGTIKQIHRRYRLGSVPTRGSSNRTSLPSNA